MIPTPDLLILARLLLVLLLFVLLLLSTISMIVLIIVMVIIIPTGTYALHSKQGFTPQQRENADLNTQTLNQRILLHIFPFTKGDGKLKNSPQKGASGCPKASGTDRSAERFEGKTWPGFARKSSRGWAGGCLGILTH